MEKRYKKGDKFSAPEVGALIESLRSEIKPVLEAIPDMQRKLEAIPDMQRKLDSISEQVGTNTELIQRILEELKSKVDRKDFEALEKKVASLTA